MFLAPVNVGFEMIEKVLKSETVATYFLFQSMWSKFYHGFSIVVFAKTNFRKTTFEKTH